MKPNATNGNISIHFDANELLDKRLMKKYGLEGIMPLDNGKYRYYFEPNSKMSKFLPIFFNTAQLNFKGLEHNLLNISNFDKRIWLLFKKVYGKGGVSIYPRTDADDEKIYIVQKPRKVKGEIKMVNKNIPFISVKRVWDIIKRDFKKDDVISGRGLWKTIAQEFKLKHSDIEDKYGDTENSIDIALSLQHGFHEHFYGSSPYHKLYNLPVNILRAYGVIYYGSEDREQFPTDKKGRSSIMRRADDFDWDTQNIVGGELDYADEYDAPEIEDDEYGYDYTHL